jgi:hypothetical protein
MVLWDRKQGSVDDLDCRRPGCRVVSIVTAGESSSRATGSTWKATTGTAGSILLVLPPRLVTSAHSWPRRRRMAVGEQSRRGWWTTRCTPSCPWSRCICFWTRRPGRAISSSGVGRAQVLQSALAGGFGLHERCQNPRTSFAGHTIHLPFRRIAPALKLGNCNLWVRAGVVQFPGSARQSKCELLNRAT